MPIRAFAPKFRGLPVDAGEATAAFFRFRAVVNYATGRRVFVDPVFAGVRDGDDDHRLDQFRGNQALGGFINTPFHAGKRRGRVEMNEKQLGG